MTNEQLQNLNKIFSDYENIKLVYLFGSQASGDTGPLSDYDFAVYLDKLDAKRAFDLKLDLATKLSRELKTDAIDILLLNFSRSPELKFNVIKDGRLIFKREPFQLLVEPRILNEYFDFTYLLRKYELTRA